MNALDDLAIDRTKLAELLGEAATALAPRLFAIYGTYRDGELDGFVGWGMDFGEENGALFYCPDEELTWKSESAEQVQAVRQLTCDAHLHWLTDAPSPS